MYIFICVSIKKCEMLARQWQDAFNPSPWEAEPDRFLSLRSAHFTGQETKQRGEQNVLGS